MLRIQDLVFGILFMCVFVSVFGNWKDHVHLDLAETFTARI